MWRLGAVAEQPNKDDPARAAIIEEVSSNVVEIAALTIAISDASDPTKNTPEQQQLAVQAAKSLEQIVAEVAEIERVSLERKATLEAAIRESENKLSRLEIRVA